MQSVWLKTFRSISQEEKFPQIGDLCRNTANNISFHYRTNSVKIKWSIFSINWKYNVFGPFFGHFLNFGGKKNFPEKSGSVMHNFIWVLIIQLHENACTNGKMEEWTERWKDRQKARQTLFYRTLRATTGHSIINLFLKLFHCH